MTKTDRFFQDAINKQMEIAGHQERFDDLIEFGDGWYMHFTMTVEQSESFKEWFLSQSKKRKISTSDTRAEKDFMWFNLAYGLKISDPENI